MSPSATRLPRAGLPAAVSFRKWVAAALDGRIREADLAIRIVGTKEGRALNRHYRGKDYATNVLSFPAELPEGLPEGVKLPLLGDLVLCAPVVAREAREQKKPLAAHYAHLTVHGALHLLGWDHEDDTRRRVHGAAGARDPRRARHRRSVPEALSRGIRHGRRFTGRATPSRARLSRRSALGALATPTMSEDDSTPHRPRKPQEAPLLAGPHQLRRCPANPPPARTWSSCCATRRPTA